MTVYYRGEWDLSHLIVAVEYASEWRHSTTRQHRSHGRHDVRLVVPRRTRRTSIRLALPIGGDGTMNPAHDDLLIRKLGALNALAIAMLIRWQDVANHLVAWLNILPRIQTLDERVQLVGIDPKRNEWFSVNTFCWFSMLTYSPSKSVSKEKSFCWSNFFRILLSKPGFKKSSFKSRSKPSA